MYFQRMVAKTITDDEPEIGLSRLIIMAQYLLVFTIMWMLNWLFLFNGFYLNNNKKPINPKHVSSHLTCSLKPVHFPVTVSDSGLKTKLASFRGVPHTHNPVCHHSSDSTPGVQTDLTIFFCETNNWPMTHSIPAITQKVLYSFSLDSSSSRQAGRETTSVKCILFLKHCPHSLHGDLGHFGGLAEILIPILKITAVTQSRSLKLGEKIIIILNTVQTSMLLNWKMCIHTGDAIKL